MTELYIFRNGNQRQSNTYFLKQRGQGYRILCIFGWSNVLHLWVLFIIVCIFVYIYLYYDLVLHQCGKSCYIFSDEYIIILSLCPCLVFGLFFQTYLRMISPALSAFRDLDLENGMHFAQKIICVLMHMTNIYQCLRYKKKSCRHGFYKIYLILRTLTTAQTLAPKSSAYTIFH